MKGARKKLRRKRKQKPADWRPVALRYVIGAILLFVFMNGIFGENGYLAMRRARADVQRTRQELQRLNEENRKLTGDVKALKNDPTAIERVAREEMGLAKPGELVFRLPEDPAKDSANSNTPPKP